MATNNAVNTSLSGQTGTGTFVGATSPTLVTPVLGAATATSINFGGSTLSTYTGFTSWTPVFTFATPGNLSVAYATQAGWYSRIGNIVIASVSLTCTPTFTTSTGNINITGLPFASNASSSNTISSVLVSSSNAYPTSTTAPYFLLPANSSVLQIYGGGSTTNGANFTISNAATTVQIIIQGTIIYSV